MNQQAKRTIHAVVAAAIATTGIGGFTKQRQGYWVRRLSPTIMWELEVLFEPDHGPGMFRVGWSVRDIGVPPLLGLENLPGTEHGTIGGDLGSFFQRRHGITMLCLEGVGTSRLGRLWWGTRAEPPGALTDRIRSWINHATPTLSLLEDRRALALFVDGFAAKYGNTNIHPESEDGRRMVAIALRALDGDHEWAGQALAQWEQSVKQRAANEIAREEQRRYSQRIRAILSG